MAVCRRLCRLRSRPCVVGLGKEGEQVFLKRGADTEGPRPVCGDGRALQVHAPPGLCGLHPTALRPPDNARLLCRAHPCRNHPARPACEDVSGGWDAQEGAEGVQGVLQESEIQIGAWRLVARLDDKRRKIGYFFSSLRSARYSLSMRLM